MILEYIQRINGVSLSTDDDRYVAAQGLKLVRKIMLDTETFKKYEAEEYRPGLHIQDDEELLSRKWLYTNYFSSRWNM